MEDERREGKHRFVDNRALGGLGLLALLLFFGVASSIRECIHPSEHKSVSESIRELGEAVESEYGILSAAEDSIALKPVPEFIDIPADE